MISVTNMLIGGGAINVKRNGIHRKKLVEIRAKIETLVQKDARMHRITVSACSKICS